MNVQVLTQASIHINDFILFGGILLAGIIGGEVAHRTRYFPRITGFIVVGFLLGPSLTGILSDDMLERAKIFTNIALGLILFQLGLQLDLKQIRQNIGLFASGLTEGLLSFVAITLVLVWMNVSLLHALLVAAVGVSSSPAVVLLVSREFDAKGPVTERALNHVAINNFLSFFIFTLLLPFVHYSQHASWLIILLQPFYQAGLSLVLAFLLASLCIWIARHLGQNESLQFALLVGIIMVAIGLSNAFNCSNLLTLLATGVLVRNMDRKDDLMLIEFGHAGDIFFVLLFVMAGANLHIHALITAGWAALAFVGARFVSKSLGILVLKPLSPLTLRQTACLGLTQVPMAGMAIGLTGSLSSLYPMFSQELTSIVLGAVAILESIGPIATEYALKQSGEIGQDKTIAH